MLSYLLEYAAVRNILVSTFMQKCIMYYHSFEWFGVDKMLLKDYAHQDCLFNQKYSRSIILQTVIIIQKFCILIYFKMMFIPVMQS